MNRKIIESSLDDIEGYSDVSDNDYNCDLPCECEICYPEQDLNYDESSPQLIEYIDVVSPEDFGINSRTARKILKNYDGHELNFSYLMINSVPKIPDGCKSLKLNFCKNITYLPELPDSIEGLFLDMTKISTIERLPKNLRIITLEDCAALTEINAFPDSLEMIYLNRSSIQKLPVLPANLRILYLNDCKYLTELPSLPAKVKEIHIRSSRFKQIGPFPDSVTIINLSHSAIEKVINLPKNLKKFYCINTKIRDLPFIPESLEFIDFDYETIFPPMPEHVICWGIDEMCRKTLAESWIKERNKRKNDILEQELKLTVLTKNAYCDPEQSLLGL